jgi:ribosomal protein L16 Arg81 hydroxylase
MPEMYLDGHKISHDDLVDIYIDMDEREARAPRLKRIRALLEGGATVNSFGQEAHFPKLAEMRKNFALAFGAEVEIATFYSQNGHQGLAPHYDCVEIFVLQIAGSKRWYVSSQRVEAPLVGYGEGTWFVPDAPHAQINLEPGDVLYMPRGTFHHAIAISDESLHATVAVKVPSYIDILTTLAKSAPDLDSMRSYLPLTGATAHQEVKARFLNCVAEVLDGKQFEAKFQELLDVRSRG